MTKLRWLKEIIKKEHEGPYLECNVICIRCKWLTKNYEYHPDDPDGDVDVCVYYCTRPTGGVVTADSIHINDSNFITPMGCPLVTQEQKDMMRKARQMNKK